MQTPFNIHSFQLLSHHQFDCQICNGATGLFFHKNRLMYNYLSVAKLDHVVQQFTDIKEHYDKMR